MRFLLGLAVLVSTLISFTTAASCLDNPDYDIICQLSKQSGKHVLLDSHRYTTLIGTRWVAVDEDSDGKTWQEKEKGPEICKRDIKVESSDQESQENWLFSDYIPYLDAHQIFVNITYKFRPCSSSSDCEGNSIEVYRYDSTQQATKEERKNTLNYQHKKVLGQEHTGQREHKQWSYNRTQSANGFYLGIRDTGTTARMEIKRIVVWYRTKRMYNNDLGLTICDCTPTRIVETTDNSITHDGVVQERQECHYQGVHRVDNGITQGKDNTDETKSKIDDEDSMENKQLEKPYFQLGDNTYSDGSTALLDELLHHDHSLMCVTQYDRCCKKERKGVFYYPDNTVVPVIGGPLVMRHETGGISISLAERRTFNPPSGTYCCEIPDITTQTTRICIDLVYK